MEKVSRKSNWVRGSCIGRGSFGAVSQAINKSDGEIFAVKSVNLSTCLKSQVAALENEIQILRQLSSPWVVEYLGDDTTVENCATSFRNLHLEYLPGGTAADLAKRAVADVDETTLRSRVWCVVSALSYVHSMGIVHCDVKGRNVLVVGPTASEAKLADFGSAAEFSAAAAVTARGSPLWMAPEVVRGEYQGPESDVWSLGCTVIEMVTGKPTWVEDHGGDTLCRIGYSDELPELPAQLSELGWDFVGKCLRRDRAERWSCDQLLRHPFITSSAPVNPISRQSPRCVLDWLNSEFSEDEDESSLVSELRTHSARGRIGKLASNKGAIWESDGWVEVRNVISEKPAEVSNACCCGDEGEGTSSEYPKFLRTEEEIEGSISEYSDLINIERTNSEYSYCGDGGVVEMVDCGGGWLGLEAGSSCRCRVRVRGWDWAVDSGRKGFTQGLISLLNSLLYFATLFVIHCRLLSTHSYYSDYFI